MNFPKYASVITDLAIDKVLDYGILEEQLTHVQRGVRVAISVRGRLQKGYILEVKEKPDFTPVLPLGKVEQPLIDPDLFDLALWMAKYYCAPLRNVFKAILPSPVRGSGKEKQQLFVRRAKTREELKELCEKLRNRSSNQAAILDVMLNVHKGILLTELLEQSKGSRSAVDSLVKKGALLVDQMRIDRSPFVDEEYFRTKPKTLNPGQEAAFKKIEGSLKEKIFETHLLYGVTGSGKTEIYLQAIDKALQMGMGAIMLVPEISLTPQMVERFRSRFEGTVALLHCRLSEGERFDEWNRLQSGAARIVIGARSAIFSPVKNLGLIIVDEEHEASYKASEGAPCYHARDIAVMRGKMAACCVVLGSATPSIESYYNAQQGKYLLSRLGVRAEHSQIPQVTLVDMRKEYEKAKRITSFSDSLLTAIQKRIEKGEQTILFLNRRGYHTTLWCPKCSHTAKCLHCDVALTFHLNDNCLSCHLCDYTLSPPPKSCPSCRADQPLRFRGVGTEQVEKALHAIFPEVRTLRIDGDTTRHKGSHQKLLRAFGSGKADVLIGTQMISKGLHFPEVTLVGVLNGDAALNIPDFRASENTFQLLTQVAGRAGRGTIAGEVILQTCLPENTIIQQAAAQDYEAFFEGEIALRKLFHYPPFTQLAKLIFSGPKEGLTLQSAQDFRKLLLSKLPVDFELLPVIASGHAKVKDRYRFQFLVKGPQISCLSREVEEIRKIFFFPRETCLLVDINPLSTFF